MSSVRDAIMEDARHLWKLVVTDFNLLKVHFLRHS